MSSHENALMVFASECPRRMAARLSMPAAQRVENGSRFKFSRRYRITSSQSIKHLFERARYRVTLDPIRVVVAHNCQGYPRLCVVVAKRVVRKAVDRNWCKRRIREWFRQNRQRLPSVDMHIAIRSYPFDSDQLEACLSKLLDRLKDDLN